MSVRAVPSGCVIGKPSSKSLMLRTPKGARAFEPRIEMNVSRGPLPWMIVTPGLKTTMSATNGERPGVFEFGPVDDGRLAGGLVVDSRNDNGHVVSDAADTKSNPRRLSRNFHARAARFKECLLDLKEVAPWCDAGETEPSIQIRGRPATGRAVGTPQRDSSIGDGATRFVNDLARNAGRGLSNGRSAK
jgi:hypothetical protein